LEGGVVFEGTLTHEDLLRLLQRASVYLHTARTEAFNTAIAESMALGVPVIGGARSGGVPYQLDYGRAGLLVDVGNHLAVADAIEKLIANEELGTTLRERAWSRVNRLCQPSVVIEAYEKIYQQLLAEPHSSRRQRSI
jgi:glycosyltransferase involved in cell wall biosynthesis